MTAPNGQSQTPRDPALTATYASPASQPFTFTEALSAPLSNKVEHRTAYLRDLRKAAHVLQANINRELTKRMEEDKARGTGAKNGETSAHKAVDEAKAEENYGEEAQEAED